MRHPLAPGVTETVAGKNGVGHHKPGTKNLEDDKSNGTKAMEAYGTMIRLSRTLIQVQ